MLKLSLSPWLGFGIGLMLFGTSALAAKFELRFDRIDAPGGTLFDGRIEVMTGKVLLLGSWHAVEPWWIGDEPGQEELSKFKEHSFFVEDKKIADDLLTIARHFEHCEKLGPQLVSGGESISISFASGGGSPVVERSYVLTDNCKRAGLMSDLCRDFQMIVIGDFLKDESQKKQALASFRSGANLLASSISDYAQAFSLLQDACKRGAGLDWERVSKLVRYHESLPPLKEQNLLTIKAHEILSASFSKQGLEQLFGKMDYKQDALVLRMGGVRMCQRPTIFDPRAYADRIVLETFGLVYPPVGPGVRVGILDVGVERLILHFLWEGDEYATTAFADYSLSISGTEWRVTRDNSFNKKPYPKGIEDRLKYLSDKSGLLTHLFGGETYPRTHFLDVREIAIKDEEWKIARIDYRLNEQSYTLPLFANKEGWTIHRAWEGGSYSLVDDVFENRDFFRTFAEVKKYDDAE